jgi:hypothetical protein
MSVYIFATYDKISGFRGGETPALGEVKYSCKWTLMFRKSMPPLSSWLSLERLCHNHEKSNLIHGVLTQNFFIGSQEI